MTDLIQRPRRLRKSPALRAMFEETTLSLNDLVLPIFVEEELDDYKAIDAMPGVMRIPEKHLAREIERIANAGIRSVMTFGISTIRMTPVAMPGKKTAWWRACRVSANRPCRK
jgi:porphobilinogen synthase